MALKRAVMARREARTTPIESKVRVSVSNAHVERAIRKWRGQFRKLKIHLETRINKKIPATHPMIPFMVSWAADVIRKYKVRSNGRTSYEEMTGHRVKHIIAGFGEHIQFMTAKGKIQNMFEGEWSDGYVMGVVSRSSEYLVARGDQLFKCPTIRRKVDADAYDGKCLENITVDFNEYIRKGATTLRTEVIREDAREDIGTPKTAERSFQPRGLHIWEGDLKRYGYIAGGAGCAWHSNKVGLYRGHSKDCRSRIEGEMRETEEGTSLLEGARTRREEHDKKDKKEEGEEHEAGKKNKRKKRSNAEESTA